ncbi:MAG TPA: beta-ketoacyl synthase N-terminal-like domain-containing protein, partial [bacterium]
MPFPAERKRVVVTGLGLVTPLGTGVEKSWISLCDGRSGISRIQKFDPADIPSQVAGEVRDFNAGEFIEKREIKKMDLFIQYAIAAGKMAVSDSGIVLNDDLKERTGAIIGVGIGGLPKIEHFHSVLLESGHRRVSPFFIPMVIGNLAAGHISIEFGLKGPNFCTTSACASGAHAIGESLRMIQRGEADAMVAGGSESTITPLTLAGFASMKALSTEFNNAPEKASRPFDKRRGGFVIAEGAGILVLEEMEFARKRGARIY